MSTSWTKEQQEAIEARGQDLLVSAAAGSGKTAVLVARIMGLVTDPQRPVDIDRLLVVTFTRAAAGEMRARIGKKLEEALAADPDNVHLQQQGVLLHHAQITTIDGFCGYVVQNYFQTRDIDPGYRIAEEGELRMLRGQVLADVLEEAYAEGTEQFLRFMDAYAPGKRDDGVEKMLLDLAAFAESDPDPELWLSACAAAYAVRTAAELDASPWFQDMLNEARQKLITCADEAEALSAFVQSLTASPATPAVIASDAQQLRAAAACGSFEALSEALSGISWKVLRTPKDIDKEDPDWIAAQAARKAYKNAVKTLREGEFAADIDELLAEFAVLKPHADEVVRLVNRFRAALAAAKRKKNLVDFSDLAHYALEILLDVDEQGRRTVRTAAARELSSQFAEVMIDEYQDSNFLQERLLWAVSGDADGRHNRFMVGDMKQSIYAFRMARPDLFLEKYNTYPRAGAAAEQGEEPPAASEKNIQLSAATEKNIQPQEGAANRPSAARRIDLSRNFRSRAEVLDVVNGIFSRVMVPEVGGITYDDAAALHAGAAFPASPDPTFPTAELLLINREAEGWEEDRSREAMMQAEASAIAGRLRAMVGQTMVCENGSFRPLAYRDCVILLRAVGRWADIFVKTLKEAGIPAYAVRKSGYFSAPEVVAVLNYLRILDNPRQDIPLEAVLRSPMVGCTDAELACVVAAAREAARAAQDGAVPAAGAAPQAGRGAPRIPLWEAVQMGAEKNEKLRDFLALYERLRGRAVYTPIHELLRQVLDETGYGLFAAAMPAGAQRAANLDMLVEKAVEYEKTSYHGLFHFVRYIERIEEYKIDSGEVSLYGESEDLVRIMTIHKSKGLEFPVVIVAGLGGGFNSSDTKGAIIRHARMGIGLDVVDLAQRVRYPSLYKRVVIRTLQREALGEELRVLYVALTRAKEKLILSGHVSREAPLQAALGRQRALAEEQRRMAAGGAAADTANGAARPLLHRPLSCQKVLAAKNMLDWILPAVPAADRLRIHAVAPEEMGAAAVLSQKDRAEMLGRLRRAASQPAAEGPQAPDVRVQAFLQRQSDFVYPYAAAAALPAKLTVSELKRRETAQPEDPEEDGVFLYPGEAEGAVAAREEPLPQGAAYIPDFLRASEPQAATGAARGIIYHRVFQHLRLAACPQEGARAQFIAFVQAELARLAEQHLLTKEEAAAVRPADFAQFLATDIGRRMCRADRAGTLRREQPFVLDVAAKEIDSDWPSDENILVQGTIDAYFMEEGRFILVDYKTDISRALGADGRPTGADLTEKYRGQLDYYARALTQISGGVPVAERWLYAVRLGRALRG